MFTVFLLPCSDLQEKLNDDDDYYCPTSSHSEKTPAFITMFVQEGMVMKTHTIDSNLCFKLISCPVTQTLHTT